MPVLAIDIGGTKIAAGVVDSRGVLSCRSEVPTAAASGADRVVGAALDLAESTLRSCGQTIAGVGVSTGGDVDAERGRINYATPMLPGYTGADLRGAFVRRLGLLARIEKDGNCAALAEATIGSGRGFTHALTVIVGTGIGAGCVVNGDVLRGAHGGALNPGQIQYDDRRTYEDVASCGALSRRLNLPIQRIAAQAEIDPELKQMVGATGDILGRLLALCAAILDPDVIVLAGSILLFGPGLVERVQASYSAAARPPLRGLAVRPAALGPDSALIGAALAWRRAFGESHLA
jgi:glucokinase